ncbi:MAG: pantoate--beta-alanine ligase [Alphaproteobacteria bacterium]|nr:pantoate--beta-alanine ligase [Alphaproteobacteria bacterium]
MSNPPARIETASNAVELRLRVRLWRNKGARVALVPTMGALHEGHLALVRAAKERADRVVVSNFVNPAQFAPHEDFARYPRDLAGDRAKLEAAGGTDLIYAPETKAIYPDGFSTKLTVEGPGVGLESDVRPHFFSGVATVVAKLLIHCAPDFVMFGEKDYQQLLVVKQMVRDLDLPLEVVGVPTVREADGVALSSRNAYLTPEQRKVAGHLNRVLARVAERAKAGVSIPQAEAEGAAALLEAGFDRVDYVALRDAETLALLRNVARPSRVLAAARVGATRLIDNMAV